MNPSPYMWAVVFMDPQWMVVQWIWDNDLERAGGDPGCYHPYCWCDSESDADEILYALMSAYPHASPGDIDA